MNQLFIDPFLLIRSPAYSFQDFNAYHLQKVLDTEFFRAAIFLASQPLYSELLKMDFAYNELNPSIQLSLWKYFNRMCYRALPYGSFASYSLAGWNSSQSLLLSSQGSLVINPDFKSTLDFIGKLDTTRLTRLKFYPNNSIYRSNKELRFMSETNIEQRKLAIVQLKSSISLEKLLKYIEGGRNSSEILNFLQNEHGAEAPVEEYLNSLIRNQVIVSELMPNVTGRAYHERCQDILLQDGINEIEQLRSLKVNIDWRDTQQDEFKRCMAESTASTLDKATYSLYERVITGGAGDKISEALKTTLKNMDRLTAGFKSNSMQTFKDDFVRKYDQQEVSLMVALDPGIGIGYQNLAAAFENVNDNFVGDLLARQDGQLQANWGALEKMIFKKWSGMNDVVGDSIIITDEDLMQLPESDDQLPPGLFILFRVAGDKIWIDSIGGVSGIELSARFGTNGTQIEKELRRIAQEQIAANPEFVFAEIVWSTNDRVSNINQRGEYFSYEIPILTHPMRSSHHTIQLNDLMVSVRDNTIFLRSDKLNRYILPRLSSAFNFKISNVPVFRFLCDLQFQEVKSSLSFTLSGLFPGMDYYPRLEVNNTIISPATWILSSADIERLRDGENITELGLKVTPFFCLQEGDNFLVFERDKPVDLEIFKKCVKGKTSVTLTEYPFRDGGYLYDDVGKEYAAQTVACFVNKAKSYQLPSRHLYVKDRATAKVKRSFLPGEEWLYIKLYMHYSLTDAMLIAIVLPLAAKYRKVNPDFKWFYIRYLDPGNHLRLRFYNGGASCHELLTDLIAKLQPYTITGRISEVLLDSYQRELEKYSFSLIDEVETLFYRNTEYILAILERLGTEISFKISFGVHSALRILQYFIPDKKERLDFLISALNRMSQEFSRDKEILRKLDTRYRDFQKKLLASRHDLIQQEKRRPYRKYIDALKTIVVMSQVWDESSRQNLLINLVHMHLNRVFEHAPREYEFLVYHFMKKHQAFLNHTTSDGF